MTLPRKCLFRLRFAALAAVSAVALSACGTSEPKVGLNQTKSKEYFSESEVGVKASPRVASLDSGLRRGGGRYQVGKPYKVKGKWYYPKEDPDYAKVGSASWYGSAFHGRLTANGEVYDMARLTAAHPTMPLPSYARVTNLDNGSSVIVRVNDRGPFAHNRIIDLSKRAAELLDYTSSGVAKVRVEYAGPAPLHGQDEQYLVASYKPGNAAPDPSDGLPSGVMVAMNGPTPTTQPGTAGVAFTERLGAAPTGPAAIETVAPSAVGTGLPAQGPIIPDRPVIGPAGEGTTAVALLSYADERVKRAAGAFDKVLGADGMSAQDVTRWWAANGQAATAAAADDGFIVAGSWRSRETAERYLQSLTGLGRLELEAAGLGEETWYALNLYPDAGADLDATLKAAWAAGAGEAFAVRN